MSKCLTRDPNYSPAFTFALKIDLTEFFLILRTCNHEIFAGGKIRATNPPYYISETNTRISQFCFCSDFSHAFEIFGEKIRYLANYFNAVTRFDCETDFFTISEPVCGLPKTYFSETYLRNFARTNSNYRFGYGY